MLQEWDEFFGPSTVAFIVSWFLQLAATDCPKYPAYFIQDLCRAVHSIDPKVLSKVEVPAHLAERSRPIGDELNDGLKK